MSWIGLALALLKFVNSIILWARERELVTQGRDEEIAEVTQAILRKTDAGKKIMAKVDAMSDADVDIALRGLEPK